MEIIKEIQQILRQAKQNAFNSINKEMVGAYWLIGRRIIEEEQHGENRAAYGKSIIKNLSNQLKKEFGKGFSPRNLEQMRLFYLRYPAMPGNALPIGEEKTQTLSAKLEEKVLQESLFQKYELPDFKLSWSHYQVLLRIEDENERAFYEIESANNQWSLRELKRQYDSALYLRLALSMDKEGIKSLSAKGQVIENPEDAIKDPYVLEFLNFKEHYRYSETDLENKLIDKLEYFLLELGKGFTFVARQKRITFEEKHFYLDLVFYNRLLKCFVVIDLKIGELKHQDIGQMQMYVN